MRQAILATATVAALALCADARAAGPLSRPYQLTHAANYDPTFSPDGKRIVYISAISGHEQLFAMGADGKNAKQITLDAADHEDPAYSPDGKRIAFVRMEGGAEVIHLMGADGGPSEALTPSNVKVIHPNWHPDGSRIYYCTDDDLKPPAKNASEIQVIELATRKIATVITGGVNTYPRVSPDGKRIAFRRILGEMNSEVFVANIDGSDPKNLTAHWSFDGWPAWSPDGKRIAFASNRVSSYKIWVMDADGGNVRMVANTEGRATAPAWSPDGKSIAFPLCRGVDEGYDCEILVAPLDGAK